LKTMSAVQARAHASLRMEFRLLKAVIRDFAPDDYEYTPENATPRAKQADYDVVEIIPVSDPNAATMSQRIMQYQAALQLAQGAPQIYDLPQLHRQMLEVLGIKNAAKLVPVDADQKPRDPITENMSVLMGRPIKAFAYQDHQAHLMAHQSFMQDPNIAATLGQNPQAQQMMAAKELELKERDSDRKDQDSLRDFEIARGKLALEAAKIRKDNPQAKAVAAQQEIVLKGARARQEMTHKDQMHRLKLQQQAEQRAARSQPKEK
jgi:hypothetical protein